MQTATNVSNKLPVTTNGYNTEATCTTNLETMKGVYVGMLDW